MWTIEPADVNTPDALQLLREYFVDVANRYYLLHLRRRGTTEEIETGLADGPSEDLAPPTGVFLLGTYDGKAAGCAGLRIKDAETVELALYTKQGYEEIPPYKEEIPLANKTNTPRSSTPNSRDTITRPVGAQSWIDVTGNRLPTTDRHD